MLGEDSANYQDRSQGEDDRLNGIGPDYRFDSSYQGIAGD